MGPINREECRNLVIEFLRDKKITLKNLEPDLDNFLTKIKEQNDS